MHWQYISNLMVGPNSLSMAATGIAWIYDQQPEPSLTFTLFTNRSVHLLESPQVLVKHRALWLKPLLGKVQESDSAKCPCGECEKETVDHYLLECEQYKQEWEVLIETVGITNMRLSYC